MSVTVRNRAEESLRDSHEIPAHVPPNGEAFLRTQRRGVESFGLASLGSAFLNTLREAPDALFQVPDLNWTKANGGSLVARVSIRQIGNVACYWKRQECENFWDALRHRFFRSRVRHAWNMGHLMLEQGINTPRPMAYVINRQQFPMREFLLTEAIKNSIPLKLFLITELPNLDDQTQHRWRRTFLRSFAAQIRKLHAACFDHRDLKASNILISCDLDSAQNWLLDLDDVRRWPWLPPQRIVQNLARLNVSGLVVGRITPSEQLRFLKAYLGSASRNEWKSLWRRIALKTECKIRQNKRRGRPLH